MRNLVKPVLLSVVMIFFAACSGDVTQEAFFYWGEGYVAMPVDSDVTMSFSYFYKGKPFDNREISDVQFPGDGSVSIRSYRIADSEDKISGYNSLTLIVDVGGDEIGTETCSQLRIGFQDGTSQVYPIGDWFFDVGEDASENFDQWQAYGHFSSSDSYPYSFEVPQGVTVKSMQYWRDKTLEVEHMAGTLFDGAVDLTFSEAPLKYVKAKLEIEYDGKIETVYMSGCYCGGTDSDGEDLMMSKERLAVTQ